MELNTDILAAANKVLHVPIQVHEDEVRGRIGRLLEAMGHEAEFGSAAGGGHADMYLPCMRTIVETKRVGSADDPFRKQMRENSEPPFEQLQRKRPVNCVLIGRRVLGNLLQGSKTQILDRMPRLRRTAEEMFPLVQRYDRRTQTAPAFCAEHGISYAQLLHW